jgi:hypothetical protein
MPITLSPQQSPIIDAVVNTRRNIEIKARAGTGKTFTLIEIVKAIRGASLGQVALMAFNKDIASNCKAVWNLSATPTAKPKLVPATRSASAPSRRCSPLWPCAATSRMRTRCAT